MYYWVHLGTGTESLSASDVASGFHGGRITWDTPACPQEASEWSRVRHFPELVAAIQAQARQAAPIFTAAAPPRPAKTDLVDATASSIPAQLELSREIARYEQQRDQLNSELVTIRAEVELYTSRLELLKAEHAVVEESIEIQSFGFYRPKYGFESSEQYSARLDELRREQQDLIKTDRATKCEKKWAVDGSTKKGADMIRDQSKLMLRAFNGECDAAIAKVKYDNVVALEKRIEKSLQAINKMGSSKHIEISPVYASLKLQELYLVHEHREKLHEEREVQRAIKEQMKEEQRAEQEIQSAVERAQKEEAQKEEALERARHELAEATGRQHEKLEQLVGRLENELVEALDRKAKAIARAQLTRSGHVYVLSNIGCFGQDCYKIGMTRRLEPLERVFELGDASVPFQFDVHAMIYSEDAPALERSLHEALADRRVNRVNPRKEFFRVTLQEIQDAVSRLHGVVTFVTVPEAEEFRKSNGIQSRPDETATAN